MPVILYVEMPACDVVEPNSQGPLHTGQQISNLFFCGKPYLFACVDEKILSICIVTNVFDY